MIATASLLRNERGLALPMALLCMLTLTGLVLAFLTVSAFEPQISANHAQGTQARFAAEAGIEWGFDYLVSTANWNNVLTGACLLYSSDAADYLLCVDLGGCRCFIRTTHKSLSSS